MTECSAEISVSTAARMAGCSPDTIWRWIEEGRIVARRSSPRGWWRIERSSLIPYLDGMSPQTPQEISTGTAARMAGCSRDTIVRWIEEGRFMARHSFRYGWWRIKRGSLVSYLARLDLQRKDGWRRLGEKRP